MFVFLIATAGCKSEPIGDEIFGKQKSFSNIIKAEETHIGLLKDIYNAYNYKIPEDKALEHIILPQTIEDAFDLGVLAEIDNIAMYEKFLSYQLPEDIKDVFIKLMNGSKSHLTAFEKKQ